MFDAEAKWKKFKITHEKVLQLPKGKTFIKTPVSHFVALAKKKGRVLIVRALVNLERWNKTTNPAIAGHARSAINAIKKAFDKGKNK